MNIIRNQLIIILISLFVYSCVSDGCYENTEAFMRVTLYETDSQETMQMDSISVYGIGFPDSLIYNQAKLQALTLPLDPGSDRCGYVISKGLYTDTLTVSYTYRPHFISKGCGYTYLYDIKSVMFTGHSIDTVLIINSNIDLNEKENLRAFY